MKLKEQILFRIEQLTSLYEAYTFLCNQKIIPKNFESKEAFQFAKDNLFILILSQLYSLFDKKSGLDLRKLDNSDELKKEIENDWKKIEKPITRIRHNLGFHGAKKIEGTKDATKAVKELGRGGITIAMGLFPKLKKWQILQSKNLNKIR